MFSLAFAMCISYKVIMKLFWKIFAALSAVLALLFTVYMLNLDMKLMRSVVLPFLNKHYDKQKREHVI